MRLPADTLNALLDAWPVGRLATVTPEGLPHVVPVVFVRDGDCVWTPVDGKRKTAGKLARVRNVEAHGHASLVLDQYDSAWERLWWVRLDGPIMVAYPAGEDLARLSRRLQDKYPQYADVAPFTGEPTALALRWERVAAWAQTGTPEVIEQAVA